MQAELTDGRIIDLDGYCECGCGTITMRGPCWIRVDEYERKENAKLLDMADKAASGQTFSDRNTVDVYLQRFAELEIVRLDHKKRQMQQHGIVRLIEEAE
jgi:hypothetical protein